MNGEDCELWEQQWRLGTVVGAHVVPNYFPAQNY